MTKARDIANLGDSLINDADDNVALGDGALDSQTTGANNVAIGESALASNTSASTNTAVGYQAGYSKTTGDPITAVGYQALTSVTTGAYSTAVGRSAGDSVTTGNHNTLMGNFTGADITTGANNTAIGSESLRSNTTASNNTAVGYQAGYNGTTSAANTLIGKQAGYYLTTANGNTFIGCNSGEDITTGQNNTVIGRYQGNQGGLDIRTSSNNIVLSDGDGNISFYKNSTGHVFLSGKKSSTINEVGHTFEVAGSWSGTTSNDQRACIMNRTGTEGEVIEIRHDGIKEGSISVSGTTTSFNGGHLARWSQTTDNTRISLFKGTVMTNLDQMAVWGDEDNEQLNCMAVSSVEGDQNVAGAFISWDDDDEDYTNDMNVAMTGDFIIRIAQGTTVQRGDLLMSAGDGTAKPQGDDIVRSKTIAKVTSTHVTCTYDDGSYCVPCVLMAC